MRRHLRAESSAASEISADQGRAGLARFLRNRALRRTARLVETPGIIVLRKVAAVEAVAIAAHHHLAAVERMEAVVRLTVAADPTAEANTDSRNPRRFRFRLITIFPRPGRVSLPTGPIFMFINPQPVHALAALRGESVLTGNDFRVTGIAGLRF
jgi:hypothetical protein